MHIEANAVIDASRERISQLRAQGKSLLHLLARSNPPTLPAPLPSELSSDTSTLLASLPSLLRLILTSAFFRLLLSDVRQLIAGLAADVATVAAEIQVAAKEVERAVDVDVEWPSVLKDKVNEVAQAVEELDPAAETQKTAKDIFIARVKEVCFF
jgi:hypothetical protein